MTIQTPSVGEITRLTWRAATYADLPAVQALLSATAAAEHESRVSSLEDLQREFDDPFSDPATDTWLALAPDGSAAAYGRVFTNPAPEAELRSELDAEIHPLYAGGEVERHLLDWLEARGSEVLRRLAAAQPEHRAAVLRLVCLEDLNERVRRYRQRGFRPVRHFYRMRRDLRQPIPERPLPPGLSFDHYRPENDEPLRQAHNEAFSDHWAHDSISANDWQQFVIQPKSFRPDLTRLVMDGAEVAAFSLNRVEPSEAYVEGYRPGWISTLGTRRPWRKRGLASALLVESMRLFQAAGLDTAVLGVDSESATGALGLYEGLGFVTFKGISVFYKEVNLNGVRTDNERAEHG